MLHFNKDGIKRGGVAHVGKFFRSKHIHVSFVGRKLWPEQPGADYTRLNCAIDLRCQKHFSAVIEYSNLVAVRDAARAGIGSIHLQQAQLQDLARTRADGTWSVPAILKRGVAELALLVQDLEGLGAIQTAVRGDRQAPRLVDRR